MADKPDIKNYSTVFFDVGMVLVAVHVSRIIENLSRLSGLSLNGDLEILWKGEMYLRFEKGLASPDEFYRYNAALLDNRVGQNDFWDAWNSCFEPIKEMIELARALKKRGTKLYVISNANVMHGNHLLKNYSFFELMDGIIWSYEANLRKPEQAIYEHALKLANVKGGKSLFFDDRPENIDGARQAGLDAVLCDDAPALARYYLEKI